MKLKVKLLEGGIMPGRAHGDDAGMDLFSPGAFHVPAGGQVKVGLGIAWEMPPGWCAILKDRSGLAARGLHVLGGVVDCQYRGEVAVVLANLTRNHLFQFKPGDRIAQALFVPVPALEIEAADELSASERGVGGFGSTGA